MLSAARCEGVLVFWSFWAAKILRSGFAGYAAVTAIARCGGVGPPADAVAVPGLLFRKRRQCDAVID